MTENFKRQLLIIQKRHYPEKICGFQTRDILASATKDPNFMGVVSALDDASRTSYDARRSILDDFSSCLMTLNIYQDGNQIYYGQHSFEEYLTRHAIKSWTILESDNVNVLCSRLFTIVFTERDTCLVFLMKEDEVRVLIDINIRKFELMLQLISLIRGLELFNFPLTLTGSHDKADNCHRVFRQFTKCIQPTNMVYDDQIISLRLSSDFHSFLWGRDGARVLTTLMARLTYHLYNGILYDERLLAATFRRNLTLESPITIISVKKAFVSSDVAVTRYQFHLVIELNVNAIADDGLPTNKVLIDINQGTQLAKILNMVQQLPTELKHNILEPDVNLCNATCMCKAITCKFTTHNGICKSRRVILDDVVNIMFPISFRLIYNPQKQPILQVYLVYTTTLDGGKWFGIYGIPQSHLLTGNLASSDLMILNRLHFQGNLYDMNEVTFGTLKVTDCDTAAIYPSYKKLVHANEHLYMETKHRFRNTNISCSHESEFIPKIPNIEQHYLLFD